MCLFTKESVQQVSLEPWKKDAFEKFEAKLTDQAKPFPCIPATIGHQQSRFRYAFISPLTSPQASKELAEALEEYAEVFRKIGPYTSLIIFYEPSSENFSVEQYEQLFWKQLVQVGEMDTQDWPSYIPEDPHNPLWEFCFHGEQLFMYGATPVHQNRQSRYFPYFMLAVTPRSVLEQFYETQSHKKIKKQIRKRLTDYDTSSIHPDLNFYGQSDNFEWKQYFLHDDETTIPKCPFHRRNI